MVDSGHACGPSNTTTVPGARPYPAGMQEPIRTALIEAADRWGTPLYVTDLDAAAANARAWQDALPGALVAYAVKANPDPALLRRLAADGFGFEVVGPVELAMARRAGAPAERIVVNGVGPTDAHLADALAGGALVNAESLSALDALLGAGTGRIGLRVNPAIDAATHAHLATGSADAKFGIGLDEVADAIAGLGRTGRGAPDAIGAHIGSDIGDPAPFGRLAELLARLADEIGAERIDMGGGFNGPIAEWAAAVTEHIPQTERLIVEPGRSVAADAGWLAHPGGPRAGPGPSHRRCRNDRAHSPDAVRGAAPGGPPHRGSEASRRSLLDPVRPDL